MLMNVNPFRITSVFSRTKRLEFLLWAVGHVFISIKQIKGKAECRSAAGFRDLTLVSTTFNITNLYRLHQKQTDNDGQGQRQRQGQQQDSSNNNERPNYNNEITKGHVACSRDFMYSYKNSTSTVYTGTPYLILPGAVVALAHCRVSRQWSFSACLLRQQQRLGCIVDQVRTYAPNQPNLRIYLPVTSSLLLIAYNSRSY